MTGNVVVLGMALVGGDGLLLAGVVILFATVLGALHGRAVQGGAQLPR